ncbi:family 43 glycosylhydrolase [Isoptericola croceus]|uniref:family 43 glycosylhydrolase n=1 Tax=Isoptericola croceus TaxID=3031406 RepID=UPI0023F9C30E|nr:family 43 glycosylhydrolase [Isoptericola croceus]
MTKLPRHLRATFGAAVAIAVGATGLALAVPAAADVPTVPEPETYDAFPGVEDPGLGAADYFQPHWYDTDGRHIQAHGGQVVVHEAGTGGTATADELDVDADAVVTAEQDGETVYYWYGEDRSNGYYDSPGVSMYSSTDTYNWTNEGVALRSVTSRDELTTEYFDDLYDTVADDGTVDEELVDELYFHLNVDATAPDGSAQLNAIFERPKVLHNESTGQWVMWWHSDGSVTPGGSNYARSMAGVAVADSPTGPFAVQGVYRLYNEPSYRTACNMPNAVPGQTRDMTVFKDDDGVAYISYSSEENRSLYIARLDEDYTNVAKTVTTDSVGIQYSADGRYPRIFADGTDGAPVAGEDFTIVRRCGLLEAPAIFVHDGRYYVVASGATGWNPNPLTYYTADDILGTWIRGVDPDDPHETVQYDTIPEGGDGLLAVGDVRRTSFGSQSTHVLPLGDGRFVYMGDRWNRGAADSTYVWLPLVVGENGRLEMRNPTAEDSRWDDGWTPAYWDDKGAGGAIWTVDAAGLPQTVRAGTDIADQLPATVAVTAGGTTSDVAVTWSPTVLTDPGTQQITGTLAEDDDFGPGRTFTRAVEVEAYGEHNLAPTATVTASSRQHLAATTNDGSLAKGWDDWVSGGQYPRASWLDYTWSEPRTLSEVVVHTYADGASATWPSRIAVQYRSADGAWVDSGVAADVAQDPAAGPPVVRLDVAELPPTTGVRLDLTTETNTWQSIAEVQILGLAPGAGTELADLTVDGETVAGFDPAVWEYTAVPAGAVDGTPADAAARVEIDPATAERPWAFVTVTTDDDGTPVAARTYVVRFGDGTAPTCTGEVSEPWAAGAWGDPARAEFCAGAEGTFQVSDGNNGAWTGKDNLSVVYQPDRLAVGGSIETTSAAMDRGDNSDPRSGLVVRNDLSLAGKGSATGYVTLTTSPSGTFLQWDADGNGFLDKESAKVLPATWPVQLRLERTAADLVTGYWRASADDAWSAVGTAPLVSADDRLDAGVYAAGNNERGLATATFTGTGFTEGDDPASPLEVQVSTRCLAGKVHLAVRATNAGDVPADIVIETPYGTKEVDDVKAGKAAYQSFATRASQIPAGTVTATATGDGQSAPTPHEVAFDAASC